MKLGAEGTGIEGRTELGTQASLSATLGGYQRRQDDWTHQADLATKELEQVKKQILAAEIRLSIAEHDLENQDLQIENAKQVDESTLRLSLQAGSNASTNALKLSAWNGLLRTEETRGGPLGDWTMGPG